MSSSSAVEPAQASVVRHRQRELPIQFAAVEFFAGIGLVRLALERQGWRVALANDICPQKAAMYRRNWPESDDLAVGDIHRLDPADLPDCELFTASFPCNDLSLAGKREGLAGRESSAFWGVLRLIEGMADRRPRLVLLENVVGFLSSRGGADFQQALTALAEQGYAVDAFILNARHWTPQSRARLFVVARRDAATDDAALVESDVRPAALVDFMRRHPQLPWNVRALPSLPPAVQRLEAILEDLPDDDPRWWNEVRTDYFMNQLSPRHAAVAAEMLAAARPQYATAFRRVRQGRSMAELRTDGIAGCLRTPRGGSGRQILFKAGQGRRQVRLLTPRECARLQGAPDDYVIDVPQNQALFGFGDAVCVPAIEWIVEHYLTPLAQA